MGGGVGGGLKDYSASSSPFPLDFEFWIWDLDLGLDLGLTTIYSANTLTDSALYSQGYRVRRLATGQQQSLSTRSTRHSDNSFLRAGIRAICKMSLNYTQHFCCHLGIVLLQPQVMSTL